jgi:NAD(P)-dependent dehydrogenase (short-subunit alcohol dehydrogenase family)
MDLSNKISAVVTGGASGLGEATVRELASAGVKVAMFDLERQKERAEKVSADTGAIFCPCDVTDESSVDAAFAKSREEIGQERILINCAGTGIARRTVDNEGNAHPTDSFNLIIQINLIGTFRCIAKSAAGMAKLDPIGPGSERGAMVNTASVAAFDGQIGQAAYSASKGGVVGMTLPIARDLAKQGIRICTIAPGLFDTPLMAGAPDNVKQALGAQVPFPQRLGNPVEYGKLARQIVENGYLNGEVIRLDGAIRMSPK